MMDVKTYRAYEEDSTIQIPLARFAVRQLGSLDRFIDAIDEKLPDRVDEIVARLTELVRAETSAEPAPGTTLEKRVNALCTHHHRYPELHAVYVNLLRGLLDVDDETLLDGQLVDLSQQRFIRVRYVPEYVKLVALSQVVGKERAIDFMKALLDREVAESPLHPNNPKSLCELRENQIAFNLREQGMDWTQAILGEHQYLNKVTVCRIQKVLAAYDPEMMEIVACYPDFAMFRKTNASFALTRTQTLMNGGTCCDSCYHDERFITQFEHPPMSVFDAM